MELLGNLSYHKLSIQIQVKYTIIKIEYELKNAKEIILKLCHQNVFRNIFLSIRNTKHSNSFYLHCFDLIKFCFFELCKCSKMTMPVIGSTNNGRGIGPDALMNV